MGAGPSVSPATVAPAGKPEKAEKLDKADSNKVTSGNPGAPAQRNSTALRANEALIFNYIRKKVTRRTPDVPLLDILKVSWLYCARNSRILRLIIPVKTRGLVGSSSSTGSMWGRGLIAHVAATPGISSMQQLHAIHPRKPGDGLGDARHGPQAGRDG